MTEAFAWPEASAYLYTGTGPQSAVVALAQNVSMSLNRTRLRTRAIDGTYYSHQTGQQASVTIAAAYTNSSTIQRIFESATAVHMHLAHNHNIGSAGYFLYSGDIDVLTVQGAEAGVYTYSLVYVSNVWSAYGG